MRSVFEEVEEIFMNLLLVNGTYFLTQEHFKLNLNEY